MLARGAAFRLPANAIREGMVIARVWPSSHGPRGRTGPGGRGGRHGGGPGAARVALDAAMGSGTYGIVIVDQELLRGIDETARRSYEASTLPLVIEVPGEMAWRAEQEAPTDALISPS